MEVESELAYIYTCIYILSAFRNAINTTIISCGHNETWSHDSKTFRHSLCCFAAANGAWFWYFWLSYKVCCLTQVTIGVRGNVVLLVCLGKPSNCKHGEGLVSRGDVLIMKMWIWGALSTRLFLGVFMKRVLRFKFIHLVCQIVN